MFCYKGKNKCLSSLDKYQNKNINKDKKLL